MMKRDPVPSAQTLCLEGTQGTAVRVQDSSQGLWTKHLRHGLGHEDRHDRNKSHGSDEREQAVQH